MKESNHISDLFAKAASEPVHTSFDDTKKLFLATIPANSTGGASKAGLLTKKWIIMLSILTTGAVITALFFVSNSELDTSQKATKLTFQTEQKLKEKKSVIGRTPKKNITKPLRPELPGGYLPPKTLEVFWNTTLIPLDNFRVEKSNRSYKEVYRLPALTEEEKRENEKRKKEMVKSLYKMNKHLYAFIPSASITIDSQKVSIQSFIIQKHEVSNIEYKTFLFDLLIQERNEDFIKAKPDQKRWTELFGEGMKTMENNYFSDEAYNSYPVVNVSREGAEMYCIWLSKEVNAYTYERGAPAFNDIRLPYRSEWVYAANSGVDSRVYPWSSDSLKNEAGCYLANYLPETGNYADDGGFNLVKVGSYNPNDFGLYCMVGNAAEMVYDQVNNERVAGTAGGSWTDKSEFLKINGNDPRSGQTEGSPSVGFRVVMTYLNN